MKIKSHSLYFEMLASKQVEGRSKLQCMFLREYRWNWHFPNDYKLLEILSIT